MKQSGIKQLFNILLGSLVMGGYFMYESILFGAMLWIGWNISVAPYLGLSYMTYFQAVGFVFVIKILKFDSGRMNPPAIIVPKQSTPKVESKEL
jgi:hypothetical protein